MIAHNNTFFASVTNIETETFSNFCALYRQRQDTLLLLRQLVQMIKAVQRHRGMSMALLGGNNLFQSEFDRLQQQLEHRLLSLQALAKQTDELLSERDQDNLRSAWVTISHDWQQDSVIDNYELHCHLVEQLLGMLAILGKQLEQPVSILVDNPGTPPLGGIDGARYPKRFRNLEVLHFTTRQMPAVIEQIGRIRALATYAAAIGHCDSHHDGKLRYVLQNTRVNNEKLRHQTKRLENILEHEVSLLGPLKSYEIKLAYLLNTVEQDILAQRKITANSNRLFNVASDIIDVYFKVVDDGLNLLSRWQEDDMENWLQSA
jgi:hypothetical protein